LILAGDVGGTKILLEVGNFRSERWHPLLARRYLLAEFDSMEAVLEAFMAEWKAVRPARARITAGAIGVAGPAIDNCVTMTNRPWRLSGDRLGMRFGIPNLRLINDLAAAAAGLDALAPSDFLTIQPGKTISTSPRVLLGVGTGLGVAYLVSTVRPPQRKPRSDLGQTSVLVVAGEGGHVGFSPSTPEQVQLWKKLAKGHPRVEAEHVVSGSALNRDGIELFCTNLGSVAGDQALNVMATGGVFLCGGVIARIAPSIAKESFRAAFAAKGVHSSILMKIPVRAVLNERLTLIGAAKISS
jgi:glucokinase